MSTTTISARIEKQRNASKPFPFSLKQRLYLIAQAIGVKTSLLLLFVLLAALTVALAEAGRARTAFPADSIQKVGAQWKSR